MGNIVVPTTRRHCAPWGCAPPLPSPVYSQACSRYAGTFEWLAIGDDDTAFLYNRAAAFLSHIDHAKVLVGLVADDATPSLEHPLRNVEMLPRVQHHSVGKTREQGIDRSPIYRDHGQRIPSSRLAVVDANTCAPKPHRVVHAASPYLF